MTLTSSPVTVRSVVPGALPDDSCWWVMMPSISTRGGRSKVTTSDHPVEGLEQRVVQQRVVWSASGPRADLEDDLEARALLVAVRHLDALQRLGQRAAAPARHGGADQQRQVDAEQHTVFPSRLRHRHAQGLPGSAVRSSGFMASLASHDPPELLRVAQRAGGDEVEPVPRVHGRPRPAAASPRPAAEAPPLVGDDAAVGAA